MYFARELQTFVDDLLHCRREANEGIDGSEFLYVDVAIDLL